MVGFSCKCLLGEGAATNVKRTQIAMAAIDLIWYYILILTPSLDLCGLLLPIRSSAVN